MIQRCTGRPSWDLGRSLLAEVRLLQTRSTELPCNYEDITNSMRYGGWRGHPVDVAEMLDGAVTSMDNTRIRTARETGTPVQTRAHEHNEALTADEVKRFRKSGTS